MKTIQKFFHFLIMVPLLSGCFPGEKTALPTNTERFVSKPTTESPTMIPEITVTTTMIPALTPMPSPTTTYTPLPSPSLDPEQSVELIQTLLREPVDCAAPCLWGIVPGSTTFDEAKSIMTYMGMKLFQGENLKYTNFSKELNDNLSISITLTINQQIINGIEIKIDPEKQQAGVERRWFAYSPETIIRRYGTPSRVEFFLGRAAPSTMFLIKLYYDPIDTIIEYYISDLAGNPRVCPLQDQFEGVRLWMGKEPLALPFPAEPIEQVTSMTVDDFAELMTGDPENACFVIDGNNFP